MSSNNNMRPDLKGKRKKAHPANANPLFCQWLTEWRDEASERGWKSSHTYAKALKTLKLFPLTLESGKDCRLLQNFGDKICKMLDEKLAEHQRINSSHSGSSSVSVPSNEERTTSDKTTLQKKSPAKTSKTIQPSLSSTNHNISDNSESDPENLPSPPKKKRQSGGKSREYVPAHRSGPYAIILTLYRYMQDPNFKGYLSKKELLHAAQSLCDKSFTMPDPGSHYTAWSSMTTLLKKGLIDKESSPARFSLTEAGFQLGGRLENAENSGISHSDGNNTSQYSTEVTSSDNSISQSKAGSSIISSHEVNGKKARNHTRSSSVKGSSTLSSSCSIPKTTTHRRSSHVVLALSDSDGEIEIEKNSNLKGEIGLGPSNASSQSQHSLSDAHDDPVLIISDCEDYDVSVFKEKPLLSSPIRKKMIHSLSPSPSPPTRPLPILSFQMPDEQKLNGKDKHFSISPSNSNNINSLGSLNRNSCVTSTCASVTCDDGVIKIEDENEGNGGNFINLTLEEEPSKSKFNQRKTESAVSCHIVVGDDDDDDDELPDLCDFIPLSERLINRGMVSSTLLNSHVSKSNGDKNKSNNLSRPAKNSTSTSSKSSKFISDKAAPLDLESLVPSTSSSISSSSLPSSTSDKTSFTNICKKSSNSSTSGNISGISDSLMVQSNRFPKVSKKTLSAGDDQQISSVPFPFTISSTNSSTVSSHASSSSSSSLKLTSEALASKPVPLFTFQPGTFDIVLCVDQREFYGSKSNSKTLLPDLIKSGIHCDLRHLNISDLLWVAREKPSLDNNLDRGKGRELVLNYAIERKRMDDLVSSISSGRLKEQKFRLKHCGISELIILIEEYGSIQNFSLSEDRIKQTIVNSHIIDGFEVKQCGSSREAVNYLSVMTRFLQSHLHTKMLHAVSHEWLKDNQKSSIQDSIQYLMPFNVFNDASVKQKTLCVREMFAKHLLQLPGVSLERADAITKVYPTLSLLNEAYKKCNTEKAKESLLASIKCGAKERNLGIAVSRTVSMLYNAKESLT